jgi:hypothetical protein
MGYNAEYCNAIPLCNRFACYGPHIAPKGLGGQMPFICCYLPAYLLPFTCCHLPAIFLHLSWAPKKLSLTARQIIEVHVVSAQRRRCFPTANILNDLSNHFSYCQMLDVSSDLRPSRFCASNEVRMACNPASPKRKHHRNRQQVSKIWVDVP